MTMRSRFSLAATIGVCLLGVILTVVSIATAERPTTPQPIMVLTRDNVPGIREEEAFIALLRQEVADSIAREAAAPADQKAAIAAGRAETEGKLKFAERLRDDMLKALANPPDPLAVAQREAARVATQAAEDARKRIAEQAYWARVRIENVHVGDGYIMPPRTRETSPRVSDFFIAGTTQWVRDGEKFPTPLNAYGGLRTKDLTQGGLLFWGGIPGFSADIQVFDTPDRSGIANIVGGSGAVLDIQTESGSHFRFDLSTMAWLPP